MTKINNPTDYELRIFSLILAAGFCVIGAVIPYFRARPFNLTLLIIAAVIFMVGMLAPKLMIYPRKYWIIAGNILGKINGTILFTIMYFLIFTTVGVIFRMVRRDRMKLAFRNVTSTLILKKEISPFEDPF